MRFDFETEAMNIGSGELLMMAMPHHVDTALQTAGMGKVYRTTYGFMTGRTRNYGSQSSKSKAVRSTSNSWEWGAGVLGESWDLSENLPTIEWYSPQPIDPSRIDTVRAALMEDVPILSTNAPDPYFFGKQVISPPFLLQNDVAVVLREDFHVVVDDANVMVDLFAVNSCAESFWLPQRKICTKQSSSTCIQKYRYRYFEINITRAEAGSFYSYCYPSPIPERTGLGRDNYDFVH